MCAEYLEALVEDDAIRVRLRKHQLAVARWILAPVALRPGQSGVRRFALGGYFELRRAVSRSRSRSLWLMSWLWNWWQRTVGLRIRSVVRRARGTAPASVIDASSSAADAVDDTELRLARSAALVAEFDRVFPHRPDRLTTVEALDWFWRVGDWQKLFARYDIVQCYATDPIRALVTAKHPYVAFEHGTLRDFTMGDDPLHRLNALAYRSADHVLITNGDCLAYAQRLGIERYTPMVHPVDVDQHAEERPERAAQIRRRLGAGVLLLCPLRHDWAIKGTDIHLRALPNLVDQHGPGTVLALCEWGAEVDRSVELIEELGCGRNVRWLPPLDRPSLLDHLKAADVVLDQMALPHFGATAPQALAAGRPVVMSYEPESTEWIAAEPAPILSAFDPAEVVAAVNLALDADWRRSFEARAADWVDRYHHPRRIVGEHCRIYRAILGGT